MKAIQEKIAAKTYRSQTAQEIARFGEYPSVDFQELMYAPWQEVVDKIDFLLGKDDAATAPISLAQETNNPSSSSADIRCIDDVMLSYERTLNSEQGGIEKIDADLYALSQWYIEWYHLKHIDSEGASVFNLQISTSLLKFNLKARDKFIYTKIDLAFKTYQSVLNGLSESIKPCEKLAEATEKTEEKSHQKHKKNGKNKASNHKKKKKSQAKKPVKAAQESDEEDEEISAEGVGYNGLNTPDLEMLAPVKKAVTVAAVSMSSNTLPPPAATNKKKWKQSQDIKPQPKSVVVKAQTPQYCFDKNPYLTKEVVEKFLDIFGNKLGDVRSKNGVVYQRQGWGTIDDLEKVLKKASWFINQRESVNGVVNEKHGSSTISFRMPNSSKNIVAPIIKFHDDHKSKQDMREITHNFIVRSLEYFGYTEDFFERYYKTHFLQ